MKCDRCDNEATVHEVTIHKGAKVEKHLCEQCAQEEGVAIQSQSIPAALLSQFMISGGPAPAGAPRALACEHCGMTYEQFRQHDLLGCPDCYHAFEKKLMPLLDRVHEGGTAHLGKTPKRSAGALVRERRIFILRKQLETALASEQYERAAELRDALRDSGVGLPGARTNAPTAPEDASS